MPIIITIGLLLLALALWAGWMVLRRRRRDRLFEQPLPAEWVRILERNVSLYRRLPPDLRRTMDGLVNVFLDDKQFVGCSGLTVTDEMRVTVAGNACLLLLGRDNTEFRGFQSILVYPDAFVTTQTTYDGYVEVSEETVRSGESWQRGPVVLAWADVREDLRYAGDGRNVVLHEFAHKLDEQNAGMDGLPVLGDGRQHREWARVLGREYESLQQRAEEGEESFLDTYGAESPAEFFAVATEAFFENAPAMKLQHPELYEQLSRFYNLDPVEWRGDRG